MCKDKFRFIRIILAVLFVILTVAGCAGNMTKDPAEPPAESVSPNQNPSIPARVMGEVRSVTATVAEIDYETRHATLKMPDGTMVPVAVSEDAYNFDQVKVGDLIDISYTQSVAIKLEKESGGGAGVSTSSGIERAPKGQKPQGTIYNALDVRAKVVAVDYKTRTVNLSGPDGNVFPVVADKNVQNFEGIKIGDTVLVRYTEAVAISVRPANPLQK